jgi:hypothetical protein
MDRNYLFLQRFPPALHDKVRKVLAVAEFTTSKKGISTAPKNYREYERAALIGQLILADPELAPYAKATPGEGVKEAQNPANPPADGPGAAEREA